MNRDQLKGRVKETKGKVKDVAGKILDDEDMELEGNIHKTSGRFGRASVTSRKISRSRLKNRTSELNSEGQTCWLAVQW